MKTCLHDLSAEMEKSNVEFDQQVTCIKGNGQSVLEGDWMMDDGKLKTTDISDDIDRAFDG